MAGAQQARDPTQDQRLDSARERLAPGEPPPSSATPPRPGGDFTLVLSTPFSFISNVPQLGNDRASDLRATPEAELTWERQFEAVRLTADLDVLFDRYRDRREFDADSVFTEIRVDLGTERAYRWTPFVAYAGTYDFAPVLSRPFLQLHDLFVGASNAWFFRPIGTTVPRADADGPGTLGVRLTASAGYRFADPAFTESALLRLRAKSWYLLTAEHTLQFDPSLTLRRYVDDGIGARTDVVVSGRLSLLWTPDWLPGVELQFGGQVLRNTSSRANLTYSQWSIGPSFALVTYF